MVDTTHLKPLPRSGSIKRKEVNPDLQEERDKLAFSKDDVEHCIMNMDALKYFKSLADDMRKYPDMAPSHKFFNMDRGEQMKYWWEKLNTMAKVDLEKYIYSLESVTHNWSTMHVGVNPLHLHVGMFLSSVQNLASDEQRQ